jgi:hypothetical protein
MDDVDSLHVEIDNLNDPLVRFCFIRDIDTVHGKRICTKQTSSFFYCVSAHEKEGACMYTII